MASARSIAIRQAEALAALQKACAALGKAAGVKAPELAEVRSKEPGIETAMRLEALAEFVRAATKAVGKAEPEPSPQPSPKGRGGQKSEK
jgi:hypothetical protein